MDKVIDTDQKQLVINVCGSILKTVADSIHTMLVLEKIDFKDLAIIKGSLDTALVMIAEITENVPSDHEKELFQEKNLCHSFLIQENLMKQYQSFKDRKKGGK